MNRPLRLLCCLFILLDCKASADKPASADKFMLRSPDGRTLVEISRSGPLRFSVSRDGPAILADSPLGLKFQDGTEFGRDVFVLGVSGDSVDTHWQNRFGKNSVVRDRYNEETIHFGEQSGTHHVFDMIFRAYDDGVAFRYVLPRQDGLEDFVLTGEKTSFIFPENLPCFAGTNGGGSFHGPQEWNFHPQTLTDLLTNGATGLPLLIQTPAAWVAITESDLRDWSGLWLTRVKTSDGRVTLQASLAPRLDGQSLVKASAPHSSPWRVLMIGAEPGRLIESDLVLNLAAPCELPDVSWVQPGMMAWDHWWSGDTKMDTATLEQFIQLAADMGWPYQLIDWHWYGDPDKETANITNVDPAVDMPEVLRFAKDRGVREWVWLHWRDAARHDAYKDAFALYEKWGLAGVKIDFMDRDDQEMVNWYETITRCAAEHHLMVDFHGAFKPTGFNRTFPNQITREGVLGNEYNKWSRRVTPEHKLTLPFTRFLAGPADFTPGGFQNRQPGDFRIVSANAEVQGSRASELALFVIFDSPVCCVCDSPDHYRGQPGLDFLKMVPTVWDDTRVLEGVVGDHVTVLRNHGGEYFLGATTASNPRDVSVKLDFLGAGDWKMRLWKDAADAATNAEHLDTEDRVVTSSDTVTIHLAPNGGAVARLSR